VSAWWRSVNVRGVFWRWLLRWAVLNIPSWIEPIPMAFWSLFFLLWGSGRRGVMRNLKAIKPGSWPIANFFRSYRVFWNYACTLADNARFKAHRTIPDWEFAGWDHFTEMESRDGGAVLLTAHMGSYDLGAQLFSETSQRRIIMVRAPEIDPETRRFEESQAAESLQIEFNTKATDLALDLLEAVRGGGIVAIQGDRMTEGIAGLPATLFGKNMSVPAGPFALAMAARVPIFPVFVIRLGWRRYRLLTAPPIEVVRSRDRDADFARAADAWTASLESVVREHWQQWFTFEPFSPEPAA
jgi:lauroyl/myristoyl acyltransferase